MYMPQSGRVNGESENVRWLALVERQVKEIQFGVVQIVIHEARVVRIERTEKLLVPQEADPTTEARKS